jgi:hypothetical protein
MGKECFLRMMFYFTFEVAKLSMQYLKLSWRMNAIKYSQAISHVSTELQFSISIIKVDVRVIQLPIVFEPTTRSQSPMSLSMLSQQKQ